MGKRNKYTEKSIRKHWANTDIWHNKFDSKEEFLELGGCFACGMHGPLERAHIHMLKIGGKDSIDNIHMLCKYCHQASEQLSWEPYYVWFHSRDVTHVMHQLSAQMNFLPNSGDANKALEQQYAKAFISSKEHIKAHWGNNVPIDWSTIERFINKRGEVINEKSQSRSGKVALYYEVSANEGFEVAALAIFNLVKKAQKENPGAERVLYLDIQGHRNSEGGFDRDMLELIKDFILDFLGSYLTEVYTPLIATRSSKPQINEIPENIKIIPKVMSE